mmetsp:Transcript_27734/g.45136  ORF Transcript_27734/g.45136 Transcript_27734/m.45136 type:complete len:430 (+) Transcript_27734:199-1488(+)
MGAGKGYTMRWMSAHGYFPLESVVRIDPDHFKSVMPEWDGYVKADKFTAGNLTHRESGYIQEIAQEVALRSRRNIWVDGSLKDGDWFSLVFDSIRARFPQYKIGIFYIYADEDVVRHRIAERGKRTGRFVSEKDLMMTLQAPEKSLNKLTSKVDFIARIDNSTTPTLRSFEVVDRSGNWGRVQQYAANTSAINMFPNYLSPMSVLPTEVNNCMWRIVDKDKREIEITVAATDPVLQKRLGHLRLQLSPESPVTFNVSSRRVALIPAEASSFAFIYPSTVLKERFRSMEDSVQQGVSSVAVAHIYQNGGFVYYDRKGRVIAVTMLVSALSSTDASDLFHNQKIKSRIQFHNPYVLPEEEIRSRKDRWKPTQRPDMKRQGCKYFCWIKPRERIGGHRNPFGAFAYIFHGINEKPTRETAKMNRFFPIISTN